MEKKFYDAVDPDGTLDPAEAAKRVRHLKSLYFSRFARKRWKK